VQYATFGPEANFHNRQQSKTIIKDKDKPQNSEIKTKNDPKPNNDLIDSHQNQKQDSIRNINKNSFLENLLDNIEYYDNIAFKIENVENIKSITETVKQEEIEGEVGRKEKKKGQAATNQLLTIPADEESLQQLKVRTRGSPFFRHVQTPL
jgi:hypothetical protein